jgi:hypothetical protein
MAKRLIQARELHGRYQSVSEAAEAMNLAVPTYLAHENGSRGFKGSAHKYADFYGVDLRWLL